MRSEEPGTRSQEPRTKGVSGDTQRHEAEMGGASQRGLGGRKSKVRRQMPEYRELKNEVVRTKD